MWTLVLCKLVLRVLASQPSVLANCLLVLLLHQVLNCEQVKDIGILAVKLVIGLVIGIFFQLRSLSARTILGLGINKAV